MSHMPLIIETAYDQIRTKQAAVQSAKLLKSAFLIDVQIIDVFTT